MHHPLLRMLAGLWLAAFAVGCTESYDNPYGNHVELAATERTTTLNPEADTYVRSARHANTSYGGASHIDADGDDSGTVKQGYVRFEIGNVGKITAAKLRMYVTNASTNAVDISSITSVTWTESG